MSRARYILIAFCLLLSLQAHLFAQSIGFKRGDTIAFIGGSDLAAAAHTGHLEALLQAGAKQEVRFRNFGWEGDTVFHQPREHGFPPLREHLIKAGVSLAFIQFGRAESLTHSAQEFESAFRIWLKTTFSNLPIRLVLVIPPPLEDPTGALPKLGQHNARLREFAAVIRRLGQELNAPLLDLFSEMQNDSGFTVDGLQLSDLGQARMAEAYAKQLGFASSVQAFGGLNSSGEWRNPQAETLRKAVVSKNQLWLRYWRPHNWAFLGGDRVSQPSSRDHTNPQIRWFPAEMEEYPPLISSAEERIGSLTSGLD